MEQMRLQKYIADCGLASRRAAEKMILEGRVAVNGDTVTELGTKVDPASDLVEVDGQTLNREAVEKVYLVLNKPRGYVTTVSDPEGRRTVMELVANVHERIYPVGRLDYLSEGLLIMTNDGELANIIMHPSFELTKVYEVKIFGAVTEGILSRLRNGVNTEEGFLKPSSVRVISQLPTKTWLEFRLTEGKNREIRRLCEACGLTVDKLIRVAIEGLNVQGVAPGRHRFYTKKDLLKQLGIDKNGNKVETGLTEFVSVKKTIQIAKKGVQAFVPSDDRMFRKFRKDTYFDTVKKLKENRERLAQIEAGIIPADTKASNFKPLINDDNVEFNNELTHIDQAFTRPQFRRPSGVE